MKKLLPFLLVLAAMLRLPAQDTFSIVAMDSVTGEVGSAGASCVGSSTTYPHGAAILSDVMPGLGVVHTQAAWNPDNQEYAHELMMAGLSPQEIIDSLVANDASGNPTTRQYGIADLNEGHPRSAAYTGVNCLNYKSHLTGPGYSIQGNILMGQEILDSMEARYLNTPGTLADRLMAALQGAKVIGADTRCAPKGTSSQSSFLRVGQPGDPYDTLWCDLWMAYPNSYPSPYPVDPIDSLQTLYDLWKTTVGTTPATTDPQHEILVYKDAGGMIVARPGGAMNHSGMHLEILDTSGRVILSLPLNGPVTRIHPGNRLTSGIYLYRVRDAAGKASAGGKLAF